MLSNDPSIQNRKLLEQEPFSLGHCPSAVRDSGRHSILFPFLNEGINEINPRKAEEEKVTEIGHKRVRKRGGRLL